MPGIDDENIIEVVRQVVAFAEKVDHFADLPERGHGDEFPLHQASGTVLREGDPFFEHGPQGRRNRVQNASLLSLFESDDEVQRVVGIEGGYRFRDRFGPEPFRDFVAHGFVEFGEDERIETVPQSIDQLRAQMPPQDFDEIGGLSGMQRGDDSFDRLAVVQPYDDVADDVGVEVKQILRLDGL